MIEVAEAKDVRVRPYLRAASTIGVGATWRPLKKGARLRLDQLGLYKQRLLLSMGRLTRQRFLRRRYSKCPSEISTAEAGREGTTAANCVALIVMIGLKPTCTLLPEDH
jgi:hypothetical protein